MIFRQGNANDLNQLKALGLASWAHFKSELTEENWQKLYNNLNNENNYVNLLNNSQCVVCETDSNELIGMAFLVASGHPTNIYDATWAYIRYVSVHPDFNGQGIGKQLTEHCIKLAKQNKEQTLALHTSEMMHKARHIYEGLGFKIVKEIGPFFGKRYWLYKLNLA